VGGTLHIQDAAITPHASVAWQHAFDFISDSGLAISSMGTGFGGLPLAQNNALVDVGVDLKLSPSASISMSYAGQFANALLDNSIRGRLNWAY
jgi:outer membrane autotransporter protein